MTYLQTTNKPANTRRRDFSFNFEANDSGNKRAKALGYTKRGTGVSLYQWLHHISTRIPNSLSSCLKDEKQPLSSAQPEPNTTKPVYLTPMSSHNHPSLAQTLPPLQTQLLLCAVTSSSGQMLGQCFESPPCPFSFSLTPHPSLLAFSSTVGHWPLLGALPAFPMCWLAS